MVECCYIEPWPYPSVTPWPWQYMPTPTYEPPQQWVTQPIVINGQKVKSIEYHENGTVKRVEYWE